MEEGKLVELRKRDWYVICKWCLTDKSLNASDVSDATVALSTAGWRRSMLGNREKVRFRYCLVCALEYDDPKTTNHTTLTAQSPPTPPSSPSPPQNPSPETASSWTPALEDGNAHASTEERTGRRGLNMAQEINALKEEVAALQARVICDEEVQRKMAQEVQRLKAQVSALRDLLKGQGVLQQVWP